MFAPFVFLGRLFSGFSTLSSRRRFCSAVGIEAESGGEIFTVEAGEVILSGGAINSPQLLMLSGVGPGEHLKELGIEPVQQLPGVGENLRDHPAVFLLFEI